jgi:transposase
MAFVLTPGHRHEQTAFRELMRRGGVKRPGPGRPRLRPQTVVGDRGYTGRPVRDHLRRRGVGAVIPQLRTEKTPRLMDWDLYRERNVVERLVGRLKEYRRSPPDTTSWPPAISPSSSSHDPDLALKTKPSLVESRSWSAPATGSSKGVINGYVLPISRRAWSSSVTMQSKMIVAPPSDPTRTIRFSACAVVACVVLVVVVPG